MTVQEQKKPSQVIKRDNAGLYKTIQAHKIQYMIYTAIQEQTER